MGFFSGSGGLICANFRFNAAAFGGAADFAIFFAGNGGFRFLLAAATGLAFILVVFVFKAFWARALPAGERLVAGFSRVDLATACLREAGPLVRRAQREGSFFPPFSIELLIVQSPQS